MNATKRSVKKTKAAAAEKDAHDKALAGIEADGKIVAALVEKINRQELAAANAWIKETSEADTFKAELGKKLNEVRPKCKAAGMTFDQFKEKYVGDLYERSKIFELMKVARGEITFDQIRQIERVKKQKATAKKVSGKSALSRTQPQVTTPNSVLVDTGGLSAKAQEQIARATGSAERPIEEVKAENAQLAGEEEAAVALTEPVTVSVAVEEPEPHTLTPEELSDDALVKFKKMVAELCPDMLSDDLRKARVFLSDESKWRPRVRKAA
jgi:hypothetical protein